ncbi:aminoglycoside phosphotransferase family protein [Paenibacillus lemnae]|nr:aminoglycoside phosphotransferase family protein [Paenibacillus lemnae]
MIQSLQERGISGPELIDSARLKGGISSILHRVSVEAGGDRSEWVLRQFHDEQWLSMERDLALHEGESLQQAASAGLPAPRLVSWDEDGRLAGRPAVLMTKLEGSVVLVPSDTEAWLDGLAASLADVHRFEAPDFQREYFSYQDASQLGTQHWSSVPEAWDQAIAYVRDQPRPEFRRHLIHRDYHPANVLWDGGVVSGIVDWVNACRGPAGVDLGHCRINLAMLHDAETADAFLARYEQHAGKDFQYDPYWDLRSLIDILFGPPQVYEGWTDLGVTGLSDALMAERLDRYVQRILEKI